MRKLKLFGNLLTITGILVVFSSSVLPLVKLPQTLTKTGPSSMTTGVNQYWIDTFIIPSVDEGTTVTVNLVGARAGGLAVTIIPYKDGAPVVGATPVVSYILDETEKTYTVHAKTDISSDLFVSVACIKNNYTITIDSLWSPYNNLRAYTYLGLSTLPAGLLIIYYDRIIEKRDQAIKKALNQ